MDVDGIKWKRTIFTHGLEITVYCRRYNIISRNLTASVRSSCYIHRRFLKRIAMMVSRWNILYLLSFLIFTFLAFFVTNYLITANIHFANLFREARMSYHFLWYRKTYIPCVNIGNYAQCCVIVLENRTVCSVNKISSLFTNCWNIFNYTNIVVCLWLSRIPQYQLQTLLQSVMCSVYSKNELLIELNNETGLLAIRS